MNARRCPTCHPDDWADVVRQSPPPPERVRKTFTVGMRDSLLAMLRQARRYAVGGVTRVRRLADGADE